MSGGGRLLPFKGTGVPVRFHVNWWAMLIGGRVITLLHFVWKKHTMSWKWHFVFGDPEIQLRC